MSSRQWCLCLKGYAHQQEKQFNLPDEKAQNLRFSELFEIDEKVTNDVILNWNPFSKTLSVRNESENILCSLEHREIALNEEDCLYPFQTVHFQLADVKASLQLTRRRDKCLAIEPANKNNTNAAAPERKRRKLEDHPPGTTSIATSTTIEQQPYNEAVNDPVNHTDVTVDVVQAKLLAMRQKMVAISPAPVSTTHNFFTKLTKAEVKRTCIEEDGGVFVFQSNSCRGSSKIAAFDMDGTLIDTSSGLVYPKNHNDWKIILNEVPAKLKSLVRDEYKIVIFTNQLGVSKQMVSITSLEAKFSAISSKLGVDMQVFISTKDTIMRKPRIGMWKLLCEKYNDAIPVDMKSSFYIGDAAGRKRVALKKNRNDHSSCDLLFAVNVGIAFKTPEQFFLQKNAPEFGLPEFNPRQFCDRYVNSVHTLPDPPQSQDASHLDVVVMVGWPASGKSSFCRDQLIPRGYKHISRDDLGTWQKCVEMLNKALSNGCNVVIDNTNLDVDSRHRYVAAVESFTKSSAPANVSLRCFVMNVSWDHARHNEKFRELIGEKHEKINPMIYHKMKSTFVDPTPSEGFHSIAEVNFIPKFRNADQEALYKLYLLEDKAK